VTDTPGLLNRKEEERNAMERLTIACMAHLPTSVLFVMDLTGECGSSVATQWLIRADLRARFMGKPWLDVFTKQDLLQGVQAEAATLAIARDADTPTPSLGEATEAHMSLEESQRPPAYEPGVSVRDIEEASSLETSPAEVRGSAPPSDRETGLGLQASRSSSVSGRDFSWQDRTTSEVQTALQVALALPEALWVSSVTEEGVEDLQAAVLQLLQHARTQPLPPASTMCSDILSQ
jgi:nucleolar GTP-binding protein